MQCLVDYGFGITTESGMVLRIERDERYEAWTLAGPDGLLLVSLPGDGLAIWSADSTPAAHDGDQPNSTPA